MPSSCTSSPQLAAVIYLRHGHACCKALIGRSQLRNRLTVRAIAIANDSAARMKTTRSINRLSMTLACCYSPRLRRRPLSAPSWSSTAASADSRHSFVMMRQRAIRGPGAPPACALGCPLTNCLDI
jgi:hypothetical protein